MFSLLQQINTIVLIQRDFVYSELESPARYISIPATPPFDPQKNVLRVEDLTFLLDSGQGRAILYELYIAQENYVEALNQWNLRSTLHAQELHPALAALNILPGTITRLGDLELKLGPLLYGTMVNTTNNCLETLRRAFEKLTAVNTKTRDYLVARFKSEDFAKFDFPDTYGLLTKKPS
jgi:hypothetical protein